MSLALTKINDVKNKCALNTKQQLCLEKINQFISQDTDKSFYLFGYAGTGKTFLIGKIIYDLLFTNRMDHIFVCAPTHQALNVIESYLRSNLTIKDQTDYLTKISFMTIHKLLEFKPVIVAEDGSKVFRSNKESKFLKQMEDKLIVIDECSMITKEMVADLNKYMELYPIKVIFLGDKAQLPPVREIESLIFKSVPKKYKYYILLDEIMRTKSPEIKEVATIIRDWNKEDSLAKLLLPIHNRKKTFKLYHKNSDHIKSTWFKNFISKLDSDNIPIILTWKNTTADLYNKIIRKFVHSNSSNNKKSLTNFVIGDYAMFNNFYVSPDDKSSFYTANMIKIIDIKKEDRTLFDWQTLLIEDPKTLIDKNLNILIKKLAKMKMNVNVNILTVERVYSDISRITPGKTYIVETIERSNIDQYQDIIDTVQEHIEVFYKKYKSETHAKKLWDVYHKKFSDPYSKLSFGYALTCHKAQGSTFGSVYVDLDDISDNPDINEVQHCLYTAATRAGNELAFMLA